MENGEKTKKKRPLRTAFGTLRFQMIAIMLLCYLLPAILLGLFTQTVLLKSMRENAF